MSATDGAMETGCCPWALMNSEMRRYHDTEWGVPVHEDGKHFEHLMMEVMQCGLSWNTVLQKREVFRQCLAGFDWNRLAAFTGEDVARAMETPGMIRAPRKIQAIIDNARCFQKVREEFGSFSEYLWAFTEGRTILYDGHQAGNIPASNALSAAVSRDLKARGFKFLGAVTVYSHLQSCGVVNDHIEGCPRRRQLISIADVVHRPPEGEEGVGRAERRAKDKPGIQQE